MKDNKNAIAELTSRISKPLVKVIGIATTVCGINVFGVITAFGIISANKTFFEKNFELILGALIVMIFLIIIAFAVISIGLCIALIKNPSLENFTSNCNKNCADIQVQMNKLEEKNKFIESYVNIFSQDIDKLYGLVAEMEIAGSIINKKKLMEIEKNVPKGTDIIILSSKYKLDEEFKPIVISNIKKGIIYKYIVSGANSSSPKHIRFLQVVESWYSAYKDSFIDGQQQIYTRSINKRRGKAKQIATTTEIDYDKQFYDHIQEYPSPFENDILTIMLYRKKTGNYNYDVVVNLPSEKKGYFSYKLSDNSSETGDLIDSILSICKEEKRCNYKLSGRVK